MKKLFIISILFMGIFTQANENMITKITNSVNEDSDYKVTTLYQYSNEEDTKGKRSLFYFVKPAKKRVFVGEPIRISFKLRKRAFLYIVTISRKDGGAYLLFPNNSQSYNLFNPKTYYVIPERSAKYRLVSDSRGKETIYVIASTKKQDFEGLRKIFSSKKSIISKNIEATLKDIFIVPVEREKARVDIRKIKIKVR